MSGEATPFSERRAALLAEAGLVGPGFCRAYTELADAWLGELLGDEEGVAVVGVGGYGRSELCPASDLDVVLVHRGRKDVAAVADRLWYPVWDAGVGLDHSVRTVKDAVAVADADLKVALGLIDARHVAGDEELSGELRQRIAGLWRKRGPRFAGQLRERVKERHARFGEVAFLLEPDLKEGRGGLRDVNALRILARATPVLGSEDTRVAKAHHVLLGARVELHRRTGKSVDRLLLEEQDGVAAALGYADADALMTDVAGAARTVAWAGDDAWRRVESWLAGPRGRVVTADRPLGPGLLARDGEVVLDPDYDAASDPALALRAGVAAVESGVLLGRAALDRLAAEVPEPPVPWPAATREALVRLLGAGPPAIAAMEALDQKGLLVRLLPEWEAVRSRPQRNAYHRFTVDRHLCEAAALAAGLSRRVARPDLLLIGTWLHDIGKGFPGDHTAVGMDVVRGIGTRMGFPPDDVDVLVALVQHHLLLADVATRRDLDDPRTVEAVAEAVGDRDLLDLLAALTEADSIATGPSAWSDWKAGLVADLVARAGSRLEGHHPPVPPALPTPAHRQLMTRGELAVEVEGDTVTVVAPDRPGLFARVAGTLAIHGLDVRSAAAAGAEGMAVEVFEVSPGLGVPPDWEKVRADLERAIAGRLAVDARLATRAREYRRRAPAVRSAAPRVLFDNEASVSATVVEVRADDAVGVLYRITRALADCDLDVASAKVSTIGHEVIDAFYVRDASGSKVVDPEHQREIERAVLAELDRAGR